MALLMVAVSRQHVVMYWVTQSKLLLEFRWAQWAPSETLHCSRSLAVYLLSSLVQPPAHSRVSSELRPGSLGLYPVRA